MKTRIQRYDPFGNLITEKAGDKVLKKYSYNYKTMRLSSESSGDDKTITSYNSYDVYDRPTSITVKDYIAETSSTKSWKVQREEIPILILRLR